MDKLRDVASNVVRTIGVNLNTKESIDQLTNITIATTNEGRLVLFVGNGKESKVSISEPGTSYMVVGDVYANIKCVMAEAIIDCVDVDVSDVLETMV